MSRKLLKYCVYMKRLKTKSDIEVIRLVSGRSNVFLMLSGNIRILVDTSTKMFWNTIQKRLTELNIFDLDYLILTHSHYDHSYNASKIREKYHAKVIIHNMEAPNLESGNLIVPDGTYSITRFFISKFSKYIIPKLKSIPCKYDILVDDNFEFNDLGLNIFLLHTPGHTPGSISIIVDDEIALVGDSLFGVFRNSVLPPYANDVGKMIDSWGKLLKTKCKIFLPSHGRMIKRELLQNEYFKRNSKKL